MQQKVSLKESFNNEGVVFPLDILSPTEVEQYKKKLEEFVLSKDFNLDAISRHKPHLYLKWANELAHNPKLLQPIKQILGEDVLLWYSVIFVKPPNSKYNVPWHQDATYWALEKDEGLTAWIALGEVSPENGCMQYIPKSQFQGEVRHKIKNTEDNLLARGQMLSCIPDGNAKFIPLNAGQASLHHVNVLHRSAPNISNQARWGIAFRYIPASNKPKTLKWLKRSATLVCGKYHHNKFRKDPIPKSDYDPIGLKEYKRSLRIATIHTLFGDTSRNKWRKVIDLIPTLFTKKSLVYFQNRKRKRVSLK